MTSLVEVVVLRRADEQVRSVRLGGYWERDSWDVLNGVTPRRVKRFRPCLAGDCTRPVTRWGYCHVHAQRVSRGVPVDWDFDRSRSAGGEG